MLAWWGNKLFVDKYMRNICVVKPVVCFLSLHRVVVTGRWTAGSSCRRKTTFVSEVDGWKGQHLTLEATHAKLHILATIVSCVSLYVCQ